MSEALIGAEELRDILHAPTLRLVDASYKMPGVTPLAAADYAAAHLPGAVYFDIDAIADRTSSLPHMFPDEAGFAAGIGALGLSPAHDIVVYDQGGWMGAPRAWWMFKAFGFARVRVLDGGLRAWRAIRGPLEAGAVPIAPQSVKVSFDSGRVRGCDELLANLDHRGEQVLDARSRERFAGRAEEPWPGRRSGRIPGSFNLPYGETFDPQSGRMKSAEELRRAIAAAGIDLDRPIVTTCGSGVTAAMLNLALDRLGVRASALYDGSWAEWGLPGELPIATADER